jgi:hypothetical protein
VTEWRDAEQKGTDPRAVLRLIAANTVATVLHVLVDGRPALREFLSSEKAFRVTYTVSLPSRPHEWLVFDLTTADADDVAQFDARLATLRWSAPPLPA